MEVFLRANTLSEALLPDVVFDKDGAYRPSIYNCIYRREDRVFVYNTLSRRLAQLSEEECRLLEGKPTSADPAPLVRLRFMVPVNWDEAETYLQLYGVLRLYESPSGYTKYEILPTTRCNARCFYCFEQGQIQCHMDMDTADAVASFIERTRAADKETELAWFGGEPLCKTDVIDRICGCLETAGAAFCSTMITNGLLWTPELVEQSKKLWHLKKVQITLDGFGEVHNRRKAYKASPEDPFCRTVANIASLLAAQISVTVRMNMDSENAESVLQLFAYLKDRFAGQKNIVFSPAILAESWHEWQAGPDAREREALRRTWRKLRSEIREAGFSRYAPLSKSLPLRHCMANSPTSVTVQPDGKLSMCQTAQEDAICGDVRQGITRPEVVEKWHCNTDIRETCRNCLWLPECTGFRMCPAQNPDCREEMADTFLHRLETTLRGIL